MLRLNRTLYPDDYDFEREELFSLGKRCSSCELDNLGDETLYFVKAVCDLLKEKDDAELEKVGIERKIFGSAIENSYDVTYLLRVEDFTYKLESHVGSRAWPDEKYTACYFETDNDKNVFSLKKSQGLMYNKDQVEHWGGSFKMKNNNPKDCLSSFASVLELSPIHTVSYDSGKGEVVMVLNANDSRVLKGESTESTKLVFTSYLDSSDAATEGRNALGAMRAVWEKPLQRLGVIASSNLLKRSSGRLG